MAVTLILYEFNVSIYSETRPGTDLGVALVGVFLEREREKKETRQPLLYCLGPSLFRLVN